VDQTAQSSVDLVSNCAVSVSFDQMIKIASVLGKPDDSEFYASKREQLNKRIHQTFFDEQNHSYGTGSQIDLLYPMLAGVVPDNLLRNVQENLMQSTETKYEGHLACGLVGIPVMMEWAKTAGNPDFIYSMLKKKSYPGYLYMLENGATATWEHWDGKRSRIHNCYNGVGQWFYQVVGGIRALDGEVAYKRFYIDPQIPEGVTWAKSEVETPRGTILVDWKLSGDNMEMDVEVPVGSTAILCLPPASEDVNVNQEPLRHVADTLNLQSGSYLVEYKQHKEAM
jgi:alpha-L-rhamnosidase